MPKLIYLRGGHLDDLRSHISRNLHFYQQEEPWLDSFFSEGAWSLSSNVSMGDIELLTPNSPTEHYDFENTKIIYGALHGISLTQASDERLWASLTHTIFWKYMRARWPVEDYLHNIAKAPENIREHYFLMSNRSRGLIRNGISRLWWYGYISYDESRSDPFELTRILLKTLDIAESILGRAFSYNRRITITILAVMAWLESTGKPFFHRQKFRDLMKYINQIGGVTVLDALDSPDLEKVLLSKIEQLSAKVA